MVIIVLSQVLNNNLVPDCIGNNRRGSKFLGGGGGGACPQIPLINMQTYMCMSTLSHAPLSFCYHPFFPPSTQNPV